MIDSERTVVADTEVIVDAGTVGRMLTGDLPLGEVPVEFLVDVLAAAPDDALGFITGRVECHTARGGDVAPLIAALRSQARGRNARAAVELVAARAAEGAGNSESACGLVDDVLDLRPDLEPARYDAAEYAAARGDYLAADAHLRRAGSLHRCGPAWTRFWPRQGRTTFRATSPARAGRAASSRRAADGAPCRR